MATAKPPKVVIMGTPGTGGEQVTDIMRSINPQCVPVSLLHGVYLTSHTKEISRIDTRSIDFEYLSLASLSNFLEERDLFESTESIEVVLDTDKTQQQLRSLSADLLSKVFPEV